MAFPIDPLPIRNELFINGAWVDITSRTRLDSEVRITNAGRANEQASVGPTQTAFTINNRDGLYSNRNPNSQYFGLLTQNTPHRVSVVEGISFLRLPAWLSTTSFSTMSIGGVSTTDKAVLDVTGDLDLRIELQPDNWTLGTAGQVLAGKYNNATANRSWFWSIQPSGQMRLAWSADGNNAITNGTFRDSTVIVPGTTGSLALRVTIDVNNGAAGHTVTFYTSNAIGGTWTQLGAPVVTAGTTSIFSGNGDLWVGKVVNSTGGLPLTAASDGQPAVFPMAGRIYAFEMRNGIGGTLVAKMDASSRTEGDTSWSDGLGTPNTWTVTSPAEISKANYRAAGQIAKLPQKWDPTGTDVYAPVVSAGLLQQLTQGAQPLRSAVYRNFIQFTQALAYWPLEDQSQSTQGANAIPGGQAMTLTDVTLGADIDFPASAGVARVNSSATRLIGNAKNASSLTDFAFVTFYFQFPSVPVPTVALLSFYTTGAIARTDIRVAALTYQFESFDAAGASLGSQTVNFGTGASPNQWLGMQLKLTKNGTGVDVNLGWFPINQDVFFGQTFTVASTVVGKPYKVTSGGDANLADASLAHVMVGNFDFSFVSSQYAAASRAFAGETAGTRFLRECNQNGIPCRLVGGDPLETELMGAEPIDTLPNILQQCVDLDGGMLFEPRDMVALAMRTRRSLYKQVGPSINYGNGELSGELQPTDDDQLLRNKVTVSRPFGSEATAIKDTGVNSTAAVGVYQTTLTRNASADTRLGPLAQQEVFLGTWDEQRIPGVQVNLERQNYTGSAPNLAQAAALAAVGIGDRLSITNTPAWIPPDAIELLIQGYTETLANRAWVIVWSSSRYGPYLAYNDLTLGANTRYRAAATTSVVKTGFNSTATTFTVTTTSFAKWGSTAGKPGNFPLDIFIAGERMTVGAIGAASGNDQVFSSVTRSVNGIVKAQLANAPVQVADIFYAAL